MKTEWKFTPLAPKGVTVSAAWAEDDFAINEGHISFHIWKLIPFPPVEHAASRFLADAIHEPCSVADRLISFRNHSIWFQSDISVVTAHFSFYSLRFYAWILGALRQPFTPLLEEKWHTRSVALIPQ